MAGRFAQRDFRGVMLYRQIPEGLELIAGIKQDPTFGPVVLAGAGGVLTELLRDSSVRIAPFGRQEAWQDAPAGVPQDPDPSWLRRHDEY